MASCCRTYKHITMYTDVTSQTVLCHMNFVLSQLEPQTYVEARNRFLKERAADVHVVGELSSKCSATYPRNVPTGSLIDGLSLPCLQPRGLGRYSQAHIKMNTDADTLYIVDFTVGYQEDNTKFTIDSSRSYPGYFQIMWSENPFEHICSDHLFEIITENIPTLMGYTQLGRNGPSLVHGYSSPGEPQIDQVPTGKCSSWPREAKAWRSRPSKTGWPRQSLKDDICSSTCHFVFKAHRLSRHPSSEFRFSFIDGEHKLLSTLSLEQKHCFVTFKMLVKYVLSPDSEISSYCLKTTLFWTLETVPSDIWQDPVHGMAVGFLQLLNKLIHFLIDRRIPQYFIRENNIIAHIEPSALRDAVKKLVHIRKYPVETLLDLDSKYSIAGNLLKRGKLSEIFKRIVKQVRIRDGKPINIDECLKRQREETVKYLVYSIQTLRDIPISIGALKSLQVYDQLAGLPKRYMVQLLRDESTQATKTFDDLLCMAEICGVAFLNDNISEEPLATRSHLQSTANEIFEYVLSKLPIWCFLRAIVFQAVFHMQCKELRKTTRLLERALEVVVTAAQRSDIPVTLFAQMYTQAMPMEYVNEVVRHLDGVLNLLVRDDTFVNLPVLLLAFYLLVDLYIQSGNVTRARETIATFEYFCNFTIPICRDSDRQHGYTLLAFSFMKVGEYWRASRSFEAHRVCVKHAAYGSEAIRSNAIMRAARRCGICKAMAYYRAYISRQN